MSDLATPVADLCAALGVIDGVEAVAIGGSRATGTTDAASDWDVGLYYRGIPISRRSLGSGRCILPVRGGAS